MGGRPDAGNYIIFRIPTGRKSLLIKSCPLVRPLIILFLCDETSEQGEDPLLALRRRTEREREEEVGETRGR